MRILKQNNNDKFIIINNDTDFRLDLGWEETFQEFEEETLKSIINPSQNFETVRYSHKPYIGNTNILQNDIWYYFFFTNYNTPPSHDGGLDYSLIGLTPEINRLITRGTNTSFFRLEFYMVPAGQLPNSHNRKLVFTKHLPIPLGEKVFFTSLKDYIYVPIFTGSNYKNKENMYLYWFQDDTVFKDSVFSGNTFYVCSKFYNTINGEIIYFGNNNMSILNSVNEELNIYNRVEIDRSDYTYTVYSGVTLDHRIGDSLNNSPIKFYKLIDFFASPTPTPSVTPSISKTPSVSLSPGPSSSVSPTPYPTVSPTRTPTVTPTPSVTPSITPSNSVTPSISVSATPSQSSTPSVSLSVTPSNTPSNTPSRTTQPSPSPTPQPNTLGFNTNTTYATDSQACTLGQAPNVTLYYRHGDNFQIGTQIFTNVGCTTVFVGNSQYYKVFDNGHYAVQVDSSGWILAITDCSTIPSASLTPTVTPTPSVTPSVTSSVSPTPSPTRTPPPTQSTSPLAVGYGLYISSTWSSAADACRAGNSPNSTKYILVGHTLQNGEIFYNDQACTSPFAGNENYYRIYHNSTWYSAQVSAGGYISNLIDCSTIPSNSATPSITPTPTVTPSTLINAYNISHYTCDGMGGCGAYQNSTDIYTDSPLEVGKWYFDGFAVYVDSHRPEGSSNYSTLSGSGFSSCNEVCGI